MATTLTSKDQVIIPKQIRDALNLAPGCSVDFAVNSEGEVVIHRVGRCEMADYRADGSAARRMTLPDTGFQFANPITERILSPL